MEGKIKVTDFFKQELLTKQCKQCGKSHDRKSDFCSEKCHQKWYYQQNKKKLLKTHSEWNKNNKDKVNQTNKKWQKNNEKYFKEYRQKNKNKQYEYNKEYYKKNKEYFKEYYEKHKAEA